MPRATRTAIAPEIKAQAVAELSEGASIRATAQKYGVSRTAVQQWRAQAGLHQLHASPPKQDEWVDLVIKLTHESLTALITLSQHFQDKEWLGRQRADSLAILYGVQFDKLARMVAALTGDRERPALPGGHQQGVDGGAV